VDINKQYLVNNLKLNEIVATSLDDDDVVLLRERACSCHGVVNGYWWSKLLLVFMLKLFALL